MYSKHRSGSSSWWIALWIYAVAFFLVTLTFFQTASSAENSGVSSPKVTETKISETKNKEESSKEKTSKDLKEPKSKNEKSKKVEGKIMFVNMEVAQGDKIKGTIKIKLDAEKAPKTVANFMSYVEKKFFDGTIFHRVISDFMIQGGGFEAKGEGPKMSLNQKKTESPIKNEANNGLKNARMTIAMARTNDPHSATAQFFINLKDNGFLNFSGENVSGWGYAVFGEVVEGKEIVDKIAAVPTTVVDGNADVPREVVKIISIKKAE